MGTSSRTSAARLRWVPLAEVDDPVLADLARRAAGGGGTVTDPGGAQHPTGPARQAWRMHAGRAWRTAVAGKVKFR
ncbi:MAG: hypothetical protein HY691_15545 [Chloroflexi bacterium]|nr:hypothetical protein [Chloroflexota bacterium]